MKSKKNVSTIHLETMFHRIMCEHAQLTSYLLQKCFIFIQMNSYNCKYIMDWIEFLRSLYLSTKSQEHKLQISHKIYKQWYWIKPQILFAPSSVIVDSCYLQIKSLIFGLLLIIDYMLYWWCLNVPGFSILILLSFNFIVYCNYSFCPDLLSFLSSTNFLKETKVFI